jgi:hypothetical protein
MSQAHFLFSHGIESSFYPVFHLLADSIADFNPRYPTQSWGSMVEHEQFTQELAQA